MVAITPGYRISPAAITTKAGNIIAMPAPKTSAVKVQLSPAAKGISALQTVTFSDLTSGKFDLSSREKIQKVFARPITVDLRKALSSIAEDPALRDALKSLADAGRLGSLKGQGVDVVTPGQVELLSSDVIAKLEGTLDVRLSGEASGTAVYAPVLNAIATAGKVSVVSTASPFANYPVSLEQLTAAGPAFWGRFKGNLEIKGTADLFGSQAGWTAVTTLDNFRNAKYALTQADGVTPVASKDAKLSLTYAQFVKGRHLIAKFNAAPAVSVTDVPAIRALEVASLAGVASVSVRDKASEIVKYGSELERLSVRDKLGAVTSAMGEDLRLSGKQLERMPTALGKLSNASFYVSDGPFSPKTYAKITQSTAERMASRVDLSGPYLEIESSFDAIATLDAAGKLGNITVAGRFPEAVSIPATSLARGGAAMERLLAAAPSSTKIQPTGSASVAEALAVLDRPALRDRLPKGALSIVEDGSTLPSSGFVDLATTASDKIRKLAVTGPLRVAQLADLQGTAFADKVVGLRIADDIRSIAASTADFTGPMIGSIEAQGILPLDELASFATSSDVQAAAKLSKIASGIRVAGPAADLAGGTGSAADLVRKAAGADKLRLLTVTDVSPSGTGAFDWLSSGTPKIRHALEIVGTSTQILDGKEAIRARAAAGNVSAVKITNAVTPADLAQLDWVPATGVALSVPVVGTAAAVMADAPALVQAARNGSLASLAIDGALPLTAAPSLGPAVLGLVAGGTLLSGTPSDALASMDALSDRALLSTIAQIRLTGSMMPSDLAKFETGVLAKTTDFRIVGSASEVIGIMGQLDAFAAGGRLLDVAIVGPLSVADRAKFTASVLDKLSS